MNKPSIFAVIGISALVLALFGAGWGILVATRIFDPVPRYHDGDWIQSRAGKKCGIISRTNVWRYQTPPVEYVLHVPDPADRDGYRVIWISEGEAEPCTPESGSGVPPARSDSLTTPLGCRSFLLFRHPFGCCPERRVAKINWPPELFA